MRIVCEASVDSATFLTTLCIGSSRFSPVVDLLLTPAPCHHCVCGLVAWPACRPFLPRLLLLGPLDRDTASCIRLSDVPISYVSASPWWDPAHPACVTGVWRYVEGVE